MQVYGEPLTVVRMPKQRLVSSSLSRTRHTPNPAPRKNLRDRLSVVPSPILQYAARRVAVAYERECGETARGPEVADVLVSLALDVHRRQTDPLAPIDPRLRTALGQRLLELLHAEVMHGWSQNVAVHSEVLAICTAIKRVRDVIDPDWLCQFASRLSVPDGLELVVDLAHDLRSPLTSILFVADALQRGQNGPVNEIQRRQLMIVYGAALGLSSVTSDIIELARGGDRLLERQPVPFAITTVLDSVYDIVRPIAEERRLAVRVSPPVDDQRLGHPVALGRVLLNLTTNALNVTEAGFVEIVSQESGPSTIEFSVRDSGKGIDPQLIDIVYQPARRAVYRRGRLFSETGLGLMMCRKLLAAMGSELQVETQAGWGTRFHFELDLPRCRQPSSPQAPRSLAPARRRPRIGLPRLRVSSAGLG
jgi:signal transduction histidine kinase